MADPDERTAAERIDATRAGGSDPRRCELIALSGMSRGRAGGLAVAADDERREPLGDHGEGRGSGVLGVPCREEANAQFVASDGDPHGVQGETRIVGYDGHPAAGGRKGLRDGAAAALDDDPRC